MVGPVPLPRQAQQHSGAGEQALRNGRLGFGSRSLLQAVHITLLAGKLAREF